MQAEPLDQERPGRCVGQRAPLATFDRALGNAARKVLAG
jgi:hypothetical protein